MSISLEEATLRVTVSVLAQVLHEVSEYHAPEIVQALTTRREELLGCIDDRRQRAVVRYLLCRVRQELLSL